MDWSLVSKESGENQVVNIDLIFPTKLLHNKEELPGELTRAYISSLYKMDQKICVNYRGISDLCKQDGKKMGEDHAGFTASKTYTDPIYALQLLELEIAKNTPVHLTFVDQKRRSPQKKSYGKLWKTLVY